MSLLNRPISRRIVIQLLLQLGGAALLPWSMAANARGASQVQAPGYGEAIFGQGVYPGNARSVYLPLLHKEDE